MELGPDGSDKIDELESALDFVKFDRDNLKAENECLHGLPAGDGKQVRNTEKQHMNMLRGIWQGKRLDNGEWVEGDLTRYSEAMSYITVDLLEHEVYEVDTTTLGQCIGSRDKNNKPIFEGNQIRFNVVGGLEERVGTVFWDSESCWFKVHTYNGTEYTCRFGSAVPESIEVIGRSFDNNEYDKTDYFKE